MARVDIIIPEPTPQYTEENQRQVTQSLRTMQDKLNTSYCLLYTSDAADE